MLPKSSPICLRKSSNVFIEYPLPKDDVFASDSLEESSERSNSRRSCRRFLTDMIVILFITLKQMHIGKKPRRIHFLKISQKISLLVKSV